MYKAYKFRLYPSEHQKVLISKTFGSYRFIYNHFLSKCKENKYIKAYDMCKMLKELEIEYVWLKEVDSCALRCAIFNLEDAYKNFFNKQASYPKFKNRYSKQSYRTNCIKRSYKGKEYSNIKVDLKRKEIKLPKLGYVKIRGYRNKSVISGNIINATISRENTGKYYVSVVVQESNLNQEKVIPKSIVGLDLGVKDLVVTSNGEKYANEKEILKKEKRLKRLQRNLSRKEKGSNNYNKTKQKIAILHSKIKNSRKYNIIKIVNKIVKENDIIVTEYLEVKKMKNNHNLTKLILDASFNKICTMLKWKTEKEGKYYYMIDEYFPSSQLCNHCGKKDERIKNLSIRNFICKSCENENDRDINASINIMYEGLRMHYSN